MDWRGRRPVLPQSMHNAAGTRLGDVCTTRDKLQGFFNERHSHATKFSRAARFPSPQREEATGRLPGPGAYNTVRTSLEKKHAPTFGHASRECVFASRADITTRSRTPPATARGNNTLSQYSGHVGYSHGAATPRPGRIDSGKPGPGDYNVERAIDYLYSRGTSPGPSSYRASRFSAGLQTSRGETLNKSRAVGGVIARAGRKPLYISTTASPGPGAYTPLFGA